MSTNSQFKSQADFEAWRIRNQQRIKVFNIRQRIKKGRKLYKIRNVSIHPVTFGGKGARAGTKVHMGDSLQTAPCPNCISKSMRQGLRQQASRTQIVFPYRQTAAKDVMAGNKIAKNRGQEK